MTKILYYLYAFIIVFTSTQLHAERKLIIVRHGQSAHNVNRVYNSDPNHPRYTPSNLTEQGKAEALRTANYLLNQGFNDQNIEIVYVSPLPRTMQTAEILAGSGLFSKDKIHTDDRLIELNAGQLENQSTFPTWQRIFSSEFGAEKEEEARKRVDDFVRSIQNSDAKGNILVVTHGLISQYLTDAASNKKEKIRLSTGEVKIVDISNLNPYSKLDQYIQEKMREKQIPGAAVAIVKGNKIVFSKGYGVGDIEEKNKVDENTIFQLASVSKTFASAGLAVQVDAKKLGWDEEVIRHLPQFALMDSYPTRYTTARDLLAHRTGLPAFTGDLLGKIGYSREDVIARTRYITPAVSFRGEANYSNVNFLTAGQLLAAITKTTWEEAIQSTLLDPLKMARTRFAYDLETEPNIASPYVLQDGKLTVVPREDSKIFVAAGGLASSVADLGNWMIMHLNKGVFEGTKVLSEESIDEMFKPSIVSAPTFAEMPPINEHSSFSFGMGWDNYNFNGHYIVEKAGALDGVRSIITLVPDQNTGIVVLSNLNMNVLPELVRAKFLIDLLGPYSGNLQAEFDKNEKILANLVQRPEKPANVLPLPRPVEDYLGTYANELYGNFSVIKEKDGLAIEAGPAKWKGTLIHHSNNTFLLKWPLVNSGYVETTFTLGSDGKAIEFSTDSYGNFKKL